MNGEVGVSASDDCEGIGVSDKSGYIKGAFCKCIHFEHTHGAVPQYSLCVLQNLRKKPDRGRPYVKGLPATGYFLRRHDLYYSARFRALGNYTVHGQIEFDAVFLQLHSYPLCGLKHGVLNKGIPYLVSHSFDKGKGHAAAYDSLVNFTDKIFEHAYLPGDLCTAQNGDKRFNRIVYGPL